MNSKKLLVLWGLKWNPFSPELPSEALLVTPRIDQFAWRVEQLVQEGGFALITGESGTGKSVALRVVAGRLSALRDVVVGAIERPQSKSSDFYRELGDIFAVKLTPSNRWGGFKALRERWGGLSTQAATLHAPQESEGVKMTMNLRERVKKPLSANDKLMSVNEVLPVVRVGEIPSQVNTQRWLVEGLWGASSVGVIGGAPKCAKTWLGLDMALSVATGTPCLGKYAVPEPGPVLVYLAEDALLVVREHVAGMARYRGIDLAGVDIHVITAPVLRLDRGADRTRLLETTKRLRPRLLLLDPLVRLHGIDENNAGDCLAVQNERLGAALESLEQAGRLCRTPAGWQRVH
jgi:energy-coupling factor transporter ATP-binding protein EcfA2